MKDLRIEAVVVEGERRGVCIDCGAEVEQFRIEVVEPRRARGVRLWATRVHPGRVPGPCPSRNVRAERGDV